MKKQKIIKELIKLEKRINGLKAVEREVCTLRFDLESKRDELSKQLGSDEPLKLKALVKGLIANEYDKEKLCASSLLQA